MKDFRFYEMQERSPGVPRVIAGLLGCLLICMVCFRTYFALDALGAFFCALAIVPCFVYCYAGVTNPLTKTIGVVAGGLGIAAGAIGGSYPKDMGTSIDARLDLDPTNPNYPRHKD